MIATRARRNQPTVLTSVKYYLVRPIAVGVLISLALAMVVAASLWIAVGRGGPAEASHGALTIGIDVDPADNTAVSLAAFDTDRCVTAGTSFGIDIYVTEVPDLLSWEAYVSYNQDVLRVEDQSLLFQEAHSNNLTDTSEAAPDSDGLHRVGGVDANANTPGSGANGDGVLARITLLAIQPGFSDLSIEPIDLNGDGSLNSGSDIGPWLKNASGDLISDADANGFFDGPIGSAALTVGETDTDGDTVPDMCDADIDNDGVCNLEGPLPDGTPGTLPGGCTPGPNGTDNCPTVPNPSQSDTDGDGIGDACESDTDGDSIVDVADNCPTVPNPSQSDTDGDGIGDACDACQFDTEDMDSVADTDGCPDTDVFLDIEADFASDADVNAVATLPMSAFVLNGNHPADVDLTLILESAAPCEAHWADRVGDVLTESAADSDADTVNDTFTSTLQLTFTNLTASGSALVSRNYTVQCTGKGQHTIGFDAAVSPLAPVVEEATADNSFPAIILHSVFEVADVSAVSWTGPDDWPQIATVGAPETNCTNNFDDDGDTVINDGCPGLSGNQILIQAGAPRHPLFLSGVPNSPRSYSTNQMLRNNGPLATVDATASYSFPDVDTNGDTVVDCDTEPNVTSPIFSLNASVAVTHTQSLSTTWLDNLAPPYFCTTALQSSIIIDTPFVRDPNLSNNDTILAADFVRDGDGDGVPDNYQGIVDNCRIVPNPSQSDVDGGGLGDTCDVDDDNDGHSDVKEVEMGSDPADAASSPEVCDGVDNDGDGSTDEGFDLNGNGVADCIDPAVDTDGDGIANPDDDDDDGDGFADTIENFMATDSLSACSVTTSVDAWPVDVTRDGIVSLGDVLLLIPSFNTSLGTESAYVRRLDMNADGLISLGDAIRFVPDFGAVCG